MQVLALLILLDAHIYVILQCHFREACSIAAGLPELGYLLLILSKLLKSRLHSKDPLLTPACRVVLMRISNQRILSNLFFAMGLGR